MPFMDLTLEVLKLSGWLNADADCREPKGGRTRSLRGEGAGQEAGDGGRRRGVQGREGSTADWCRIGGRAQGGAHVEHVLHVRDAGGVEAQRLVERRRDVEHQVHACDAGGVKA